MNTTTTMMINMNNISLKALLFGLLAITLLSCGTTLRQQLLDQHPEWPPKYVEMIKNGNITTGMTKDMVKAAWGKPQMNSSVTESSYSQQWVYETASTDSYSSTYVYFRDGKVVSIE